MLVNLLALPPALSPVRFGVAPPAAGVHRNAMSRPVARLLALLAAALLGAAPLAAQSGRPDIKGAKLELDASVPGAVVAVYSGDVRIVYDDVVITTQTVRYREAADEVELPERFVLTRGARRLLADRGTYNLRTRRLQASNLRLGQFPVYLSGDSVEGTLDDLSFTNATVFFRENASYTPSLSAARLTYRQGQVVEADDVRIGLLGGRFLRLPHFRHALDAAFVSFLSAKLGYRRRLGGFVEMGLHVPVRPGLELGAEVGLYSARGVMVGPSGSYGRETADSFVRGWFSSGYINDHGDKGLDVLDRPVPEERGFFEWEHRQRIGERVTVDGRFSYWRDSEVLRDFRSKQFYPVQQPDSFVEAAYAGDNHVVSGFARFHPNRYHRVVERLPEVRFDLLPSPLAAGAWQRLQASAVALQEDSFLNLPGLRTNRLDAYYGLARPVAFAPWLTVTPVAGGRVTHYTDAQGGRDSYTRALGEFGVDARLLASGTFDYRNEIWEIDGLRHLVEPMISYRYAPEAGKGRAFVPSLERRTFATYLQPLSLADSRSIDDLQRLDTLRLQFNNTLQTRDPVHGSRNLASFNLAADYWFTRANNRLGRKGLSDLHTEVALTPAPWIRLAVYERFDPHTNTQRELNTTLELADLEWWSVRLSSHFLKNDYEEYSLDTHFRLNEVWDVAARWRYDAKRSRLNEQTYGLWQRFGQTWSVRYEMSFFEGPRRESSFGFNIEVDLLKF